MSVTLTDVWSCGPIVLVRVVLKRTVIKGQQYRLTAILPSTLLMTSAGLIESGIMVPKTVLRRTTLTRAMKLHDKIFFIRCGAKLQRAKLPATSTASLMMLWCHWSWERKQISAISFPTRKWRLPPRPAIYPIPSLLQALSLYRAPQSKNYVTVSKIKIVRVKMEHARLQFWLSTK